MPAFFGTWQVISDQPVAPHAMAMARKLVGGMLEVGGIPKQQMTLDDGTLIHALIVNGVPKVTIKPPPQGVNGRPDTADLWIPRGFVVTPASRSFPRGAGLPVISNDDDPYAQSNLDPGTDMERWTAGGYHGQVLLTMDKDAGYSPLYTQCAPMHYSPLGPTVSLASGYDSRPTGKTWLAFRPSYTDFIQHYTDDSTGARRAMFVAINDYRSGYAVDNGYLMPRGFYRPGEVLSYLMTVNGTVQAGYPDGYETKVKRLNKDGPWSLTTAAELAAVGGSPAQVIEKWSIDHSDDLQLQGEHQPTFVDVGYRNGNWGLVMEPRDQWIMAGRRSFQSDDAELPLISWDGPPSINLGWMTLPVVYANQSIYTPTSILDADGNFWQKYYTGTKGYRPAFGPNVYCRGRVLGVMPNAGLVLGATVLALKDVDRLVVIAWHPDDNAHLDVGTQGLMAVARVWYVEFPHTDALRLHPTEPVTDVREDIADKGFLWSNAGSVVLPGITYASMWEFRKDGAKAVCLRDEADIGVLSALLRDPGHDGSGYFSSTLVANAWSGAFAGVVCELVFDDDSTPHLVTTSLATLPYAQLGNPLINNTHVGVFPENPAGAPVDIWSTEAQLVPHAVGYVNYNIIVAYTGNATVLSNRVDPRIDSTYVGGYNGFHNIEDIGFVVFGSPSLKYVSDADVYMAFAHGLFGYQDGYAGQAGPAPMIADIASQTFAVDCIIAEQRVTGWTPNVAFPLEYYDLTAAPVTGATTQMINTDVAGRRVRIFQRGNLLHEATYSHPYMVPWDLYDFRIIRETGGAGYFQPDGISLDDVDDSPVDAAYRLSYAVGGTGAFATASSHLFVATPDLTLQPLYARRGEDEVTGFQVGLAGPMTTPDYGVMTRPVLQDHAAAFAGNITTNITEEHRPVMGGWFRTTFDTPDTGGDWIADVVAV